MASPDVVNAAARANLERVLEEERVRWGLLLTRVRFVVAIIAYGLALSSSVRSHPDFAPSIWGALAYLQVSGVIMLGASRSLRFRRWAGLAIPFIDIPMIAYIQALQADRLLYEWQGLPTAVATPLALMVLAILSLSRTVIVLTALAATVSVVRRMYVTEVPWPPLLMTSMLPTAMAVIGVIISERIRRLLQETRKRDLVGKYILGERLGAGGMAEVFMATYSPEGGFERRVAVKRMLPVLADHADSVALFRREAELGSGLAHPNVVQVLDFGSDTSGYFMAMEYVDGTPLQRVIASARQRGDSLPWPVCCYVLDELAAALEYIHLRRSPAGDLLQLVHRDVNPPNVLVSRIGEVKLSDFGVARALDSQPLTAEGLMRGKVAFASPEQLLGHSVDARVDVWAMGVTAFELITLTRPFTGPNEVSVLQACLSGEVPSMQSLRPDTPPALEALIRAVLTRDLQTRLASAAAFREALARVGKPWVDREEGRRLLAALVANAMSTPPPAAPPPRAPSRDEATMELASPVSGSSGSA